MTDNRVTTRAAGGAESAQRLWDALRDARAEQRPLTLAQVEDALFRHYLPMARSIARGRAPDSVDSDALSQAAEVGLAQAILAWRRPDTDGFDRFASAAITDQLRRYDRLVPPSNRSGDRPTGVPRRGLSVADPRVGSQS
jgi:hypothetical protein